MSETRTMLPSVLDLIRARQQRDGGARALTGPADEFPALSYTGLVRRADALADRLRALGAGPEEPVAVLLGRSADTIVAMLAVLAADAVYCPLDVTSPDVRTAATMGALRARIAIADEANAARLPSGTVVVHPAEATAGSTEPAAAGAVPQPGSLAYVLYTSGSTGQPKGVAMTQAGLSRLVGWQAASGAPGLRTLQFTATSFDVTFQEVLSTLVTGGCLVFATDEIRRDPARLLDTIIGQRIQRLFLPYVALQLLAVTAGRLGRFPVSLEHVVTAGERLVVTDAIREFFTAIPHCRLDNHYGPTEAHLVTSHTLAADRAAWPLTPSIGAPVDGVACWVLDDELRPVRDGEDGELYVGGAGLARGYLHDPARTAQQFVASPFARTPGERLYRTGDQVRASGDGTYEFLGRADNQLKVRGFRVEPAEVEIALLSHPRIDAAAVGLREVADGVSVLVAYVQADGPVSHREIGEHVRGLLPAYMLPSRYLTVPALPRTPTGKTDLAALDRLELPSVPDKPVAQEPAAGPALTETIHAIWARVLGHGEFDAADDFFDVGGDSLLATWMVAELGLALGRPVELSLFLDSSTVAGLADALGTTAPAAAQRPRSSQILTLRPGPSARSLYLVHPLGGELIGYRELARASRAPVRLLGIGWTGEPPPFGSELSDIASTHVEQVRAVHPDGPYLLAGWSFGGVLAYEMAQQLSAAGATVEFLGLLDANPVIDPLTGLPIARTPFLGMLESVLSRLDDPAVTDAELLELSSSETWIQLMGAPITATASGGYLRGVLRTARSCMNAAMRYRPEPYSGPLHLFQASGARESVRERLVTAIRGLCAGPCTITSIPGDHWGFIRGVHVTEAASELDAALETASAARSATHGS